jgi:hypothetical protein
VPNSKNETSFVYNVAEYNLVEAPPNRVLTRKNAQDDERPNYLPDRVPRSDQLLQLLKPTPAVFVAMVESFYIASIDAKQHNDDTKRLRRTRRQ